MDFVMPRVNKKYLSKYMGRNVILMCEVIDNPQGRNICVVKASDGGEVMVHLPAGELFYTKYNQIVGKVNNNCEIELMYLNSCPCPEGEDFNMANYDRLVELSNNEYSELFL